MSDIAEVFSELVTADLADDGVVPSTLCLKQVDHQLMVITLSKPKRCSIFFHQRAVTFCNWEGNRSSDVALALNNSTHTTYTPPSTLHSIAALPSETTHARQTAANTN